MAPLRGGGRWPRCPRPWRGPRRAPRRAWGWGAGGGSDWAGAGAASARGRTIGVRAIARHRPGHPYTPADQDLLRELADRAALGIANARLFAESERRVRQLGALRAIDMVITSSLDLRVTLDVILDRVTAELGVDGADVLLFNPYTRQLDVSRSRGFLSRRAAQRLHGGDGFPGRAVLERRP